MPDPDIITRLPDQWEDEADEFSRQGENSYAVVLRSCASELTDAIRQAATRPDPFAGMYIAPDGHGTQTIWAYCSPECREIGSPHAVASEHLCTRRLWAALAAVIPEREADQ